MEEQIVNNQVQQSNAPTPQEPKRHSFLTSKIFLTALVVVILFTAVYAGIYLYLGSQLDQISKPFPTPLPAETSVKEKDPTANWKTYTNSKYEYSLKYPDSLVVKTGGYGLTSVDEESRIIVGDKEIKDYYEGRLTVRAQNQTTCQNDVQELKLLKGDLKSFAEWRWKLNKEDKNSNTSNKTVGELTETTIDGQKAYQFTINRSWVDDCGGESMDKDGLVVFVENKGVFFTIRTPLGSKLYQQILSTFKFINPENQVVCTADAKLCPDGSYVSRQPPNCEFAACP